MLTLALDTCLAACSVAIYDHHRKRVLAKRFQPMEKGHAEVIAAMIEQVMQEVRIDHALLGRILVTTGPGSFTGQRIGLSVAQGLGLSRNIPVIGIDSLRATAAPLLGQGEILVAHKAGATGLAYVQVFSENAETRSVMALCKLQEIIAHQHQWVVGTAASLIQGGRHNAALDVPHAANFAQLAAALVPGPMPRPLYLRDADAKPQQKGFLAGENISFMEVDASMAQPLAALHGQCFYEAWSASDVTDMLSSPGTLAMAAADETSVFAMVILRRAADEAEILTLAVLPRARRHGLALRLLDAALGRAKKAGAASIFLEVASDNSAARNLYEKAGFLEQGLRKAYYARKSGKCDALVMRKFV